jgi:2-isopropylmalate synthase
MMETAGRRVEVYDTTLRDGAQGAGISFSPSGALRFAAALDAFGVDFVEGVLVAGNGEGEAFYQELGGLSWRNARLAAFGRTRSPGRPVAEDAGLQGLLRTNAPVVTLVGKASRSQAERVLRVSAEENLAMVRESVAFLRERGREVVFDAEHFFDGWAEDPEYALAAVEAAVEAGADRVVLCDTNGGRLPWEVAAGVRAACARFPETIVGVHLHNDSDVAVAGTLAAVRAGARLVQGTFNGYGERVGNADLCSILPNLALKMGVEMECGAHLVDLRGLSRLLDELLDRRPDEGRPYVGANAFTHKAGMHVDAVTKAPGSFEHVDPGAVGNRRRVLVSGLSGEDNVRLKAEELGADLPDGEEGVREVLRQLKTMESDGYRFESADGSFRLLVERAMNSHHTFFDLLGFSVMVQKDSASEGATTVATLKVAVGGETELAAGEGAGPVDALNDALRKGLRRFYPAIDEVVLEDYHVRILDPEVATRATTRVLIDSSDGHQRWGTVGVSANIIEASWQALADSVEYKLLLDERRAAAARNGRGATSAEEEGEDDGQD